MTTDWARPVVLFEIRGRDTAKLQTFYAELFNWKIDAATPPVVQIASGIGGPEPGPGGVLVPGEPSATDLPATSCTKPLPPHFSASVRR